MRKIILFIIILLAGAFLLNTTDIVNRPTARQFSDIKKSKRSPQEDFVGEAIVYEVKLGNFRLGEAAFRHLENTKLNGKPAVLMTFETKVTGFYDLEKIYSDPDTFLPIQVTRHIDGVGVKEDIIEYYDQKHFVLTLVKTKADSKPKEEKYDNHGQPIYNAVSLPFYLRRIPQLEVGWSLLARFGETEYKISLNAIENVQTPMGTFEAYHFQSQPQKFEIWVTADSRRIPVKIKDNGMFGYTLTMKSYTLER